LAMLRITTTETNSSATLKLEGKLCGPWVHEVQQCWLSVPLGTRHSGLQIDLRDVSYLDDSGKDLLLRIEGEGASLVGASGFVQYLLHDKRSSREEFTHDEEKERQNGSPIRS